MMRKTYKKTKNGEKKKVFFTSREHTIKLLLI